MKKYRFLLFVLLFGFFFFPKDAFALEIDNVKFFNNNQLVHTFTKQDLQGGYASVEPVLVDAFHINYKDANLKNNYVYDFEANFNMSGNRLFNNVVDFFVYASPFGSTANLLNSTDSWFLYSAAEVTPFYDGEYVVTSSFTSTTSSNDLRFQYDLGDELILSAFRLNSAKLTNDGQDVGDVISNQTQELLENQNKNQQQTNQKLDELKKQLSTCRKSYNIFDGIIEVGRYDFSTGAKTVNDNNIRNKNFIPVNSNTDYIISNNGNGVAMNVFFYDENKRYLYYETINAGVPFKTSSNTKFINFFRGSSDTDMLQIQRGLTITPFEAYGKEVCTSKLDETNEKLDELNDSINDDNVSGAIGKGNEFFDNFENEDFGLSSIITLPLQFIQGLSNSTCYNLNVPLPFVNQNVELPCMTSIYERYFGSFLTIYQTITTGFIAYWVCINIFNLVQGFKNPDSDNIEVMDL